MKRFSIKPIWLAWLLFSSVSTFSYAQTTAREVIQGAMDNWRGLSSVGEMTMTIHRPDWQRTMTMKSWTKGEETSLVRVIAPARDAGNASLVDDDQMWSFSPRINRVIKVPSSMMAQSWMGSDFSNKDVAKSADIIDQYSHRILSTDEVDGHVIYVIESTPNEDAAVVWGKEILTIRDDYVILHQEFWGQDGTLVKYLECGDVEMFGDRSIATRMRMVRPDKPEEWTEIVQYNIEFDVDLPDSLFTLANLRNPRH